MTVPLPNDLQRSALGRTALLPEEIYSNLLGRIFSGDVPPGQVLRQEELAAHYGVSRVPVREALNRLAASGLIELRPRRGYAVAKLDPDEIAGIFDLRMVIEEHAGQIATEKRTPADIAAAGRLLAAMEQLSRTDGDFFVRWLTLNRDFHARVFESTRRPPLCRIAQMLRDMVEPYIRLEVSITGDIDEAQSDHRAIFEAFRDGNAARVAALSRRHCERTAERLLRALRRRRPSASAGQAIDANRKAAAWGEGEA